MTPEIETHLKANGNLTKRKIMLNNFLGGLSWGVGTVIGATIVVGILFSFLHLFGFIPGINDFLNQTTQLRTR